jgi:hypothetical protein
MNYIEDARQTVRRYEQRLQETQTKLLFYKQADDAWRQSQLKQDEISYTKSLKTAQGSLARIEKNRREQLDEMTPDEKKKEYDKLCEKREEEKIDYILMYGFDAWEKK